MNYIEIAHDGSFDIHIPTIPTLPTIPTIVNDVCAATADLYLRKGFVRPWVGYLAELDGSMVGSCAFTGPIQSGRVEIAYFTFPGNEGRGIATRMARYLIEWARTSPEKPTVIAHTLPEQNASTTILGNLGFICSGVIMHPEDGKVFEWVL